MFRDKLFKGQSAFTLIEVLVAAAILGVVGVAYITATEASTRGSRVVREQITARNLADTYIEVIRNETFADDYYDVTAAIANPLQYDVQFEYKFSEDAEIWVDDSTDKYLQRIVIKISKDGRPVLSVCSYKMR